MSYDVYITKQGFEIREWDPDVRQKVAVKEPRSMLHYLRVTCHIEPNVTLRDIFNAVEPHADLINLIENWAWCDVKAFHEEAKKPVLEPSTLTSIRLDKYIECDKFGASECISVHGEGPITEQEIQHHSGMKVGDVITWGIDFSPVNELADLPVVLASEVEVFQRNYDAGPDEVFNKKIGKFPTCFSLLDVLGEIYYEISFHGSPASRDARSAELVESVRQVREGKVETVPFPMPDQTVQ